MHSHERAVSLTELLIILTVVAIGSLVVAPNFSALIQRHRHQALEELLKHALQSARTRAVLTGKTTEVCASANGQTCTGPWMQGWIIRDLSSSSVLQQFAATPQVHLQWTGYSNSIRFHGNGTSPISNGRFYSCYQQQIFWQLVLNRQGRIRSAVPQENRSYWHLCVQ
ncbi:MAG: GspH/FimT family pseudopilin [Pseudomonas sp.]|uniref:GspH/FimT family pseudopilin n=1 Tax=Pseudomonas sp. TaxID=306 RepID=UPI003390C43B